VPAALAFVFGFVQTNDDDDDCYSIAWDRL